MTPKVTELDWRPHPKHPGEQAIHTFPNGLRVSVLRNNPRACTDDGTYELYLLEGPPDQGDPSAPEWMKDDTMDWQTEKQVNAILAEMADFSTTD